MLATRGGHDGASSSPHVTAAASSHRDTTPTARAAAAAAAATAATASATPGPAGAGNGGSVTRPAASAVNTHRTCSARAANARSQPRTVEAAALPPRDHPVPGPGRLHLKSPADHLARIGPPRQAPRREQHMRPAAAPAPRPARAQHHIRPVQHPHPPLRRVPPPAQHALARRARQLPAAQLPFDCTPVTVYREHDTSGVNPAALPAPVPNEETGGPHPYRRDHRAVAHEKGQPEGCPHTPSAPSATRPDRYILIPRGREQ